MGQTDCPCSSAQRRFLSPCSPVSSSPHLSARAMSTDGTDPREPHPGAPRRPGRALHRPAAARPPPAPRPRLPRLPLPPVPPPGAPPRRSPPPPPLRLPHPALPSSPLLHAPSLLPPAPAPWLAPSPPPLSPHPRVVLLVGGRRRGPFHVPANFRPPDQILVRRPAPLLSAGVRRRRRAIRGSIRCRRLRPLVPVLGGGTRPLLPGCEVGPGR
jgi:hypothetical protein